MGIVDVIQDVHKGHYHRSSQSNANAFVNYAERKLDGYAPGEFDPTDADHLTDLITQYEQDHSSFGGKAKRVLRTAFNPVEIFGFSYDDAYQTAQVLRAAVGPILSVQKVLLIKVDCA